MFKLAILIQSKTLSVARSKRPLEIAVRPDAANLLLARPRLNGSLPIELITCDAAPGSLSAFSLVIRNSSLRLSCVYLGFSLETTDARILATGYLTEYIG